MPGLILILSLVSFVAVLPGCAGSRISPIAEVTASIPDKSSGIQVGKADRATIRGVLGEPLYSSNYWRFDLFRDEAEQSETAIAFTPWPIPFAHLTDKLRRYTLVTYDGADHVSSLKSGIFRRTPNWRSVTPIQSDFLSLGITGGNLALLLDTRESGENLLIQAAGRDAFFKHLAGSTGCTIVVGAGSHGLAIKLSVDGGKEMLLPTRVRQANEIDQGALLDAWIDTLAAIRVAPGDHDLVFSSKYISGNETRGFSCRPGEVGYFQVDSTGTGKTSVWRVDRWDSMPSYFVERPLVLIYEGEWRIEAEPL